MCVRGDQGCCYRSHEGNGDRLRLQQHTCQLCVSRYVRTRRQVFHSDHAMF